MTDEALEIGYFLERAIEPRRRHLEPVVIDVFHFEHVCQLMADPFAVIDVHRSFAAIDEDAQKACAGAGFEIDEFETKTRHRSLNQPYEILHFPHHK